MLRTLLLAPRAVLLAGLLATSVVPGMHQFTGQAMHLRIVVYLVGVAVVPVGWAVAGRRPKARERPRPYPLAADVYLLVPFFFDLTGNSFHLYADVDNFDDAAHLIGVASLTLCGAALMPRTLVGDLAMDALGCVVAGAVVAWPAILPWRDETVAGSPVR